MASKRELEIIATFKDLVSKKLYGLHGAVVRASGQIRQMGENLKRSGQQMAEFGQKAAFIGAAITGPLALAFRNAEKYSAGVSEEMRRLKDVSTAFQVSVANAMIPVVHKLTNILAGLLNAWNSLSPATRQAIVQGTLAVGMFFTIGGAVTAIMGKLISLAGVIVAVAGRFAVFAAANPAILAIVAAVTALVYIFQRLGITSKDVLNGLEIGANMVAIGFHKVIASIQGALSAILDGASKVYAKLAQLNILPEGMRRNYDTAANSLKSMSNELRGAAAVQDNAIKNLQTNIAKVFQTGEGSLSTGFEDMKNKLKEIFVLIQNPPEFKIEPMVERFNAMKEVISQTARAMEQNFGDALYNVITGDLKSAKEAFKNFGRDVLRILSQVVMKMLLMKTIGQINIPGIGKMGQFFANGGVMTSGGSVALRRYSSGGVANSPQLAMFGEGSKPEAYVPLPDGRRIPVAMKGGGGGGTTIQPVIVFKMFDVTDVFRHQKEIENIVVNAISRNGSVRGAIKRYA